MNTFELLSDINEEIKNSNDRGCSILAASIFDDLLGNILKVFLIKDLKSDNDLFNGFGPLSTFSSKIKISYRLGLISEKEFKQLETFKKIRNKFAHQLTSKSFTDPDLKDLTSHLHVERELIPIPFYPLKKTNEEDLPIPKMIDMENASSREMIEYFISYMCNNLFGRMVLAIEKSSHAPKEFNFFYEPYELASENIESSLKKIKDLEGVVKEQSEEHDNKSDLSDYSKYVELLKLTKQVIEQAKQALNN